MHDKEALAAGGAQTVTTPPPSLPLAEGERAPGVPIGALKAKQSPGATNAPVRRSTEVSTRSYPRGGYSIFDADDDCMGYYGRETGYRRVYTYDRAPDKVEPKAEAKADGKGKGKGKDKASEAKAEATFKARTASKATEVNVYPKEPKGKSARGGATDDKVDLAMRIARASWRGNVSVQDTGTGETYKIVSAAYVDGQIVLTIPRDPLVVATASGTPTHKRVRRKLSEQVSDAVRSTLKSISK